MYLLYPGDVPAALRMTSRGCKRVRHRRAGVALAPSALVTLSYCPALIEHAADHAPPPPLGHFAGVRTAWTMLTTDARDIGTCMIGPSGEALVAVST